MRPTLPFPQGFPPAEAMPDAAFNFDGLALLDRVGEHTQHAQDALASAEDFAVDSIVSENAGHAAGVIAELDVPHAPDTVDLPAIDFGGHGPFGDDTFFG